LSRSNATPNPSAEGSIALLESASRLEKWPLARLLSVFETQTPEASRARHEIMEYIHANPLEFHKEGWILGITGTPGAGKSSLISTLCMKLLEKREDLSIAVLAVDPSSQSSGGALLGDRTRTRFPSNEKRLFFRSQASDLDLGGVGKKSFQLVRILRRLFDVVIIETVGIGQNEVEIEQLSDYSCLVVQPFAGDQVQFMKAGIMEVPDSFIINKCDEDALAKKSYHLLKSSLKLMHVYIDDKATDTRKIFMTSATKQRGIDELADFFLALSCKVNMKKDHSKREFYYLRKQIQQDFGNFGLRVMDNLMDSGDYSLTENSRNFEEKQEILLMHLQGLIPTYTKFNCQNIKINK
jgi:LAO/AO transport system kinase